MSEHRCLQLQNLYDLARGDKNFVLKMLQSFIDSVPGVLEQMRRSLEEGDRETLAQLAHRLKPAFMYVGAEQMVPVLNNIELHARNGTPAEELGKWLEEIERTGQLACEEAREEIRVLES